MGRIEINSLHGGLAVHTPLREMSCCPPLPQDMEMSTETWSVPDRLLEWSLIQIYIFFPHFLDLGQYFRPRGSNQQQHEKYRNTFLKEWSLSKRASVRPGGLQSTWLWLSVGGWSLSLKCTELRGPVRGDGGMLHIWQPSCGISPPSVPLLPDWLFLSSNLSRGCSLPPSQCNTQQSLFLPSISCLCLQRSSSPWYCITCVWLLRACSLVLLPPRARLDDAGWVPWADNEGYVCACLIPEHCNPSSISWFSFCHLFHV